MKKRGSHATGGTAIPPAARCQEKGLGAPPFLLYFNFCPKRECLVDILVLLQSLQTPRTLAPVSVTLLPAMAPLLWRTASKWCLRCGFCLRVGFMRCSVALVRTSLVTVPRCVVRPKLTTVHPFSQLFGRKYGRSVMGGCLVVMAHTTEEPV